MFGVHRSVACGQLERPRLHLVLYKRFFSHPGRDCLPDAVRIVLLQEVDARAEFACLQVGDILQAPIDQVAEDGAGLSV